MSSLLVQPITHADIATCAALRTATLGSLVIGRPPPYDGYSEEQIASISNDLNNKRYVHHLKVVDPDQDDEILAYGKWEIYERGRPDLEALKQPMDEASKRVDQYGRLREAAHDYFCERNGKMGVKPHIRESMLLNEPLTRTFCGSSPSHYHILAVLALLVTSSKYRQRGAGSLLVQWGVEKSEAAGLPCYVQASEQGRQLYQHYGFERIDTVEFDLTDFGLTGIEIMTEMIRLPLNAARIDAKPDGSGFKAVRSI